MSDEEKKSSSFRSAVSRKELKKDRHAVATNCIISKYEKILKIGQGTYGEVFKAKNKSTGHMVAMKKVLNESKEEGLPITSIREIQALKALRHRNIVNLLAVSIASHGNEADNVNNSSYLVMEFCQHDLEGLLQNPEVEFKIYEKKMIMKQLLRAIFFLHAKSFLHRDIKSSNILLTSKGTIKLADFGLSRTIRKEEKNYTCRVGTLCYQSPELLLGDRNYGPPIDIWAAGCVMAELWKRSPILPGSSEIEQLKLISELCGSISEESWPGVQDLELYKKIELPKNSNRKLESRMKPMDIFAFRLLDKMLIINPTERIDSDSALGQDFFYTFPYPREIELSHLRYSMFNYFM